MGKNLRNNSLSYLKKIIFLSLCIIIFSLTISKNSINKYPLFNIKENNEVIGKLIIPKINLNRFIYKIDSEENTIEKNITILKESNFPSILFLAAHSGEGNIAYFNDLDKLEINDKITLIMNHKKYYYLVKDIEEVKKNGYININKEVENQLVLTTCSKTKENIQLIINCIETN